MDYLIPEAPFEALSVPLLLVIGAAGLWILSWGADWLVEAASELAEGLGIPKVVVGATVVSLGTTTPECAVSVMAAVGGNAGLALGNAVGSVIFDTAVIFGGGCLLARLPADRFLLQRQGWVQFGSAVLLAVLCYLQWFRLGDAAIIPRWAGIGLLGLLALYLWISVKWSQQHQRHKVTPRVDTQIDAPATVADVSVGGHSKHTKGTMRLLFELLAGLIGVLIGSRITIVCVTILARRFNIPDVVISATLVACGTSLPELMVGITAIRKRHPELLVGNVIGADILNILFVTGAAAMAMPLPIVDPAGAQPYIFLWLHIPAMLIFLLFFRLCIAKANKSGYFEHWMGYPLLIGYVAFTVLSFISGSPVGH